MAAWIIDNKVIDLLFDSTSNADLITQGQEVIYFLLNQGHLFILTKVWESANITHKT